MGYTHYWKQVDVSPEAWTRLTGDASKVIAQHEQLNPDQRLAGPDGQEDPELSGTWIALNGRQPADFEPFIVTPVAGWEFCKTQWRSYDVVVCATLLRATLTIPGFLIASDGEWDGPEWANARSLYASVFGEDAGSDPFTDTDPDEDDED